MRLGPLHSDGIRGVRTANAPAGLVLAGALCIGGCDGAPTGSLYVTSGQSDEVVRLAAGDGSVRERISVDRRRHETDEPHAVALAPDGRHWYVTVAHGEPSLWKFETAGDRLVGRVDLPSGGAAMIGMSPDGSTAYVPDYDRAGDRVGRVAAVRLRDLHVTAHAEVCHSPHDAAVDPSHQLVAVACAGSDELVLLDPRDLSVRMRVHAPASAASAEGMGAHGSGGGSRPLSVAWSPDGQLLAVALHSAGAVWLVDRGGSTLAVIPVGAGPAQVLFAGPAALLTANRMDGSLSVVDVESRAELRRVRLDARYPHGVAVDDDNRIAFVAFEGTPESDGGVIAVDLETGDVLWRREAGRYVLSVAYLPE